MIWPSTSKTNFILVHLLLEITILIRVKCFGLNWKSSLFNYLNFENSNTLNTKFDKRKVLNLEHQIKRKVIF